MVPDLRSLTLHKPDPRQPPRIDERNLNLILLLSLHRLFLKPHQKLAVLRRPLRLFLRFLLAPVVARLFAAELNPASHTQVHDGVRALVEGHVEVFALLRGAGDAPADDGILEGGGGCTDFAVDDGVFVGGAGGDGAVEGVFAQVVDYAGHFADLGGC